MGMKILITSDTHDRWDYLEKAIDAGNTAGCSVMLFAGDFMSPGGVDVLHDFNGSVHFVLGNNDGELVGLTQRLEEDKKTILHYNFGESTMRETFGGLTFYMNHYPDIVRNAAETGKYDVCVYGHDHRYNEEKLNNGTLLLNPGEVQGYRSGIATCMIFETDTKSVEKIILS